MKAKTIVPENSEQPNPLPTPPTLSNKGIREEIQQEMAEDRRDKLAGWQKEIVALGEARLSIDKEEDVVPRLLRRAIGLSRVVEDFSMVGDDNDLSMEALGQLVRVIQEDLQVVRWITGGKRLNPRWF